MTSIKKYQKLTYFLRKQATPSTVCRCSMLDILLHLQHNASGEHMLRRVNIIQSPSNQSRTRFRRQARNSVIMHKQVEKYHAVVRSRCTGQAPQFISVTLNPPKPLQQTYDSAISVPVASNHFEHHTPTVQVIAYEVLPENQQPT